MLNYVNKAENTSELAEVKIKKKLCDHRSLLNCKILDSETIDVVLLM